jgi:hypothetical protein
MRLTAVSGHKAHQAHSPTTAKRLAPLRRYDLGKVLGAGSFGIVRVATEKKTGKVFACKTIPKTPKRGGKAFALAHAPFTVPKPLLGFSLVKQEQLQRCTCGSSFVLMGRCWNRMSYFTCQIGPTVSYFMPLGCRIAKLESSPTLAPSAD